MKKLTGIADLTPDPNNANRGTKRGHDLLERSLQRLGAGRSVVVDRNGIVIAGNKTYETFGESTGGDGPIIVVPSDGHSLVVVQRTDLDLLADNEDGRRARELAIADNKVAEADLEWDPDALLASGVTLDEYFSDDELKALDRAEKAEWLSSATRIEPDPPAAAAEGTAASPNPESSTSDLATAPKGQAPKTVHECPKCGYQW